MQSIAQSNNALKDTSQDYSFNFYPEYKQSNAPLTRGAIRELETVSTYPLPFDLFFQELMNVTTKRDVIKNS